MHYYIISENHVHSYEIIKNLGFEQHIDKKKSDEKKFHFFNTLKYPFGFIQIYSDIWKHYSENPDAIFIINAELKFNEIDERDDYKGVECALAFRMMNKFRNENNIFLFGFSSKEMLEKSYYEFDNYGFLYHQLPFASEVYSSIEINSNIIKNISLTELPEYHPIGLLDDHYNDFELKICDRLNENTTDIYRVFSYPYSLPQGFDENFKGIKQWLLYHDILDLFLLDLNYQIAYSIRNTSPNNDGYKDSVENRGLDILRHLESAGYSTAVAILSVSKDVAKIKDITLDYHKHIVDFIPVISHLNYHSKIDIDNLDEVIVSINKCLAKIGAKRNKIGILITHGTDTMAWTLCLLQYSLKGLKCNVVLTGSQIPLKAEFSPSDAPANVIAALYYLNQFVPPQVGVSFDMGKKMLNNNLKKVRIWNENAFDGQVNAQFNWQDIETEQKTLTFNNCLDTLILLTTGGTIAMSSGHGSTGRPDASAMEKFFESPTAKFRVPDLKKLPFYKEMISESIVSIDSSEMNPGIYKKILDAFIKLNSTFNFIDIKVESNFRWDVYPIQCSTFMKEDDYQILKQYYKTEDKDKKIIVNNKPIVYILMGYGAGNLPYKSKRDKGEENIEHYSPMNFVRDVIADGNIVILTSHVQQETPDLDYDVSVKYIEEGVLFGGDMTLSEIMIKCAYLLGNITDKNEDNLIFLKSSIMAGVGFRSHTSRIRYINLLRKLLNDPGKSSKKKYYNYILPNKNYFKQLSFADAKKEIDKLIQTISYE